MSYLREAVDIGSISSLSKALNIYWKRLNCLLEWGCEVGAESVSIAEHQDKKVNLLQLENEKKRLERHYIIRNKNLASILPVLEMGYTVRKTNEQ